MACQAEKKSHHCTGDGKVHFPEEQTVKHNSEILVNQDSENQISVHLGFLQYNHYYDIQFTVKDVLEEDVNFDHLDNVHVKVKDIRPSEDGEGHDLTIHLLAYKDRLMNESFKLTSASNPSEILTVVLHARVLGKGKGTPALKTGIHCTGISADDDSEASDWHGFD